MLLLFNWIEYRHVCNAQVLISSSSRSYECLIESNRTSSRVTRLFLCFCFLSWTSWTSSWNFPDSCTSSTRPSYQTHWGRRETRFDSVIIIKAPGLRASTGASFPKIKPFKIASNIIFYIRSFTARDEAAPGVFTSPDKPGMLGK